MSVFSCRRAWACPPPAWACPPPRVGILARKLVRVLLVEADPAMVRVFERGLRAHGFEVTSVEPTVAAASAAADESVGIAVLDVPPSSPRSRKLVDTVRA